jgi:hypothetical protein
MASPGRFGGRFVRGDGTGIRNAFRRIGERPTTSIKQRRFRRDRGYRPNGCARLARAIRSAAKRYPRAGRFTTLPRVLGSRKRAHASMSARRFSSASDRDPCIYGTGGDLREGPADAQPEAPPLHRVRLAADAAMFEGRKHATSYARTPAVAIAARAVSQRFLSKNRASKRRRLACIATLRSRAFMGRFRPPDLRPSG